MTDKPAPDWSRIEAEYRTGLYSLRELAARHGRAVSAQRIGQRAKAEGWVADQVVRVKKARQAKVEKQAIDETQIADAVEAVATQQADVIAGHKAAAKRMRDVVAGLIGELERATDKLPTKAQTAQRLAGALSTVVDIERKTYGIEEAPPPEDPYEVRLKKLMAAAGVEP